MAKTLKLWNGRPQGGRLDKVNNRVRSVCIAAYSQKQAKELLEKAFQTHVSSNEIREYFSPCWGTDMEGIIPKKPELWVVYQKKEIVNIL